MSFPDTPACDSKVCGYQSVSRPPSLQSLPHWCVLCRTARSVSNSKAVAKDTTAATTPVQMDPVPHNDWTYHCLHSRSEYRPILLRCAQGPHTRASAPSRSEQEDARYLGQRMGSDKSVELARHQRLQRGMCSLTYLAVLTVMLFVPVCDQPPELLPIHPSSPERGRGNTQPALYPSACVNSARPVF